MSSESSPQIDASKTPAYLWLSFGVSIVGGVIGFLAAQLFQYQELKVKQLEREDKVTALKIQVIKEVKDAKFGFAEAVMIYLFKPIESDAAKFDEFYGRMKELLAEAVTTVPAQTTALSPTSAATVEIQDEFPYSVDFVRDKLTGPERLEFSNELILRYQSSKNKLVSGLLQALVPELGSNRNRYRINLYIVFTLARLNGGWPATSAQYERIKALEKSEDHKDSTFAARLREALANRVAAA